MFIQQIINGLTLGAVYALIALGYTMVYGVIELINFAHGEVFMVGAYLGLLAILWGLSIQGLSPFLLILFVFVFAMLGASILGVTIERTAYRPLRKAPRLAPLITALGVSIFLQNIVMLIAGTENKSFPQIFLKGFFTIGNTYSISYLQVFIIAISFLLMVFLEAFIHKMKLGKAMRATAQDSKTANLMGIDTDKIIALTFIIGSALGAAGGIMVGMYYGIINFTMGYIAGLKAFTAAVLGGIGNITGAMFGGIVIGILESLGAGYISAEYKDVFSFIVLILILIFKPSGIFGTNEKI